MKDAALVNILSFYIACFSFIFVPLQADYVSDTPLLI